MQEPIITYAFYTQQYKGLSIEADSFGQAVRFASQVVDAMLCYGISRGVVSESDPRWSFVQRAVAMQVEDIVRMGGIGSWLCAGDAVVVSRSDTIGSQAESVTFANDGSSVSLVAGGFQASEAAAGLLAACGLTARCRRVRT